MGTLLAFLLAVFTFALFLYVKVKPHKDVLFPKYRKWYDTGDKIFGPLVKMFANVAKPVQIGEKINLDLGQPILFGVLLIVILALAAV